MSCCCDCSCVAVQPKKMLRIDNDDDRNIKIYIKKLSENAFIPKRETDGSAGMDLRRFV